MSYAYFKGFSGTYKFPDIRKIACKRLGSKKDIRNVCRIKLLCQIRNSLAPILYAIEVKVNLENANPFKYFYIILI